MTQELQVGNHGVEETGDGAKGMATDLRKRSNVWKSRREKAGQNDHVNL